MSAVIGKIAIKGAKKLLVAANTGFFGYEIGNALKNEPEPIEHTKIIEKVQNDGDGRNHSFVVILFLAIILLLVFIVKVIKVFCAIKKPQNTNSIELSATNTNTTTTARQNII